MAEPFPDWPATWTALRTYLLAASTAEKVYRALQNAPDQRASTGAASLRFWAPGGFAHPSSFRHRTRIKQKQRWIYKVLSAVSGQVYTARLKGVAYAYTAQPADNVTAIRNGLSTAIGAATTRTPIGADELQVEALVAGDHLEAEATPAELLTVRQTRKGGLETRWSPCELVVELEARVDLPPADPDSVKPAMYYIERACAGFHEPAGPYTALHAAGLAFLRYAAQPTDLSSLDRSSIISRARVDVVFSVDAGARSEFDLVKGYETPESGVQPP